MNPFRKSVFGLKGSTLNIFNQLGLKNRRVTFKCVLLEWNGILKKTFECSFTHWPLIPASTGLDPLCLESSLNCWWYKFNKTARNIIHTFCPIKALSQNFIIFQGYPIGIKFGNWVWVQWTHRHAQEKRWFQLYAVVHYYPAEDGYTVAIKIWTWWATIIPICS